MTHWAGGVRWWLTRPRPPAPAVATHSSVAVFQSRLRPFWLDDRVVAVPLAVGGGVTKC